jgi:hypothetical protein
MQDHFIGPEVKALTQACERLFGFVQGNGKLSALEVEVLHYYSRELLNHLTASDPSLITTSPPSLSSSKNAPIKVPTIGQFPDSPVNK